MSNINDATKGFFGGVGGNDGWIAFLTSKGFTSGSLQDRQRSYLLSLGYTGSLQDMLKSWYCG